MPGALSPNGPKGRGFPRPVPLSFAGHEPVRFILATAGQEAAYAAPMPVHVAGNAEIRVRLRRLEPVSG
jgi:hypothetical protein